MDDSYQRKPFSTKGAFCRLCFSQNHKLQRIFPPNEAPYQLMILKIEYCTGIRMSFSADSNASICAKCIRLTEKLFRFKQMCDANERWLKLDSGCWAAGGDHVVVPDFSRAIKPPTVTEDRMARADSCESLMTIGSEQQEENFPGYDEELTDRDLSTHPEKQETIEVVNSDESNLRPRIKLTIRLSPETVSASQDDQPSSTAFSVIRGGTKNRARQHYLVYKGYHYSDYQCKKNVYRCTQRRPFYCRVKILLRNGKVYELNDNTHDHPIPRSCD